ncbi:S-layer homology domain-containing protein [Clostridium sp. 'deep sea']|uniref:S-layer homology domain-containing protein n=1 Tax=Clostridium sp. 'deep sea' TaxID=2779445 RepID=UPI0018965C99|nr:S-layer homology domain-containing protein [Clostridium sp. 'deep sea']QOR36805.1 S-layer homology domain-containing protein [Clostridium sp. 'deep sea']
MRIRLKFLAIVISVIIFLSITTTPAQAATSLNTGDIAFVGLNADGNDDFAFVLLKDIESGTILYITDEGWDDSTGFVDDGSDGILKCTVKQDLDAGTVVHIKTKGDNPVVSNDNIEVINEPNKPAMYLHFNGDQLFIYQGSDYTNPETLIAGIHYNYEIGTPSTTEENWDGGVSSGSTSALPNVLKDNNAAIWVYGIKNSQIIEKDNFMYNDESVTSGTPEVLREAINDLNNWDVDATNSTPYSINPLAYNFTVIQKPTATSFTVSSIYQDTAHTFKTTDFDRKNENKLDHVKITATPKIGSLWIDLNNSNTIDNEETALTVDSIVTKANLDNSQFKYINSNGHNSAFTFKVNDGAFDSDDIYTATLNVISQPTVTLILDPSSEINENGGTTNLKATLLHKFNKDITVNLAFSGVATNITDYTATSSIIIPSGQLFATTVLKGIKDTIYEEEESIIVDIDSVTNGRENGIQQVICKINDDSDKPLVTLEVSSTQILENNETCTITFHKTGSTTQDITVNLAVLSSGTTATGSSTDYNLASNTITIPANLNQATTILTSVQDTLDEEDETIIIDVDSVTGGTEDGTQQHTITILDDDDPPTVTLTIEKSNLAENSGQATLKATLSEESGKNITVNLAYTGDASNEDYVAPTIIKINAGDIENCITITSTNDNIAEGQERINVEITSVNNGTEKGEQAVTATISDNDVAGLTLTDTTGKTVSENGSTDTFTIAIDTEPQDKVVLEVSSSDTGEVTASPAALTFTKDDYSNKTVTLTGVDDSLIDGNIASNISIAVKNDTSDSQYHNLNKTVFVTTTSDDTAGFTITQTNGNTSVAEDGATDSFSVVLDAQPIIDVVLDISNPNTAELTLDKSSLTFTNSNWNNPQTVTVTGIDDYIDDGNQNTDITVSINDEKSDDSFDPIANQKITVTTVDDDEAGITLIQTGDKTIVSEETTTDTFDVVLDTKPTSNVVINITKSTVGEIKISDDSLTFTTSDWNQAQTVTVTGLDDNLVDGNVTTNINLSVNNSNSDLTYHNVSETLVVTTEDNEVAGFTVTETDGNTTVTENGATDCFAVVLDARPANNVVIDLTVLNIEELTLSKSSLTFTSSNWDKVQTVVVTAINDTFVDGDKEVGIELGVNNSSSNIHYHSLRDTLSVTTEDNEIAGFTVEETAGDTEVSEAGTTDTFTVVLDAKPVNNVVININKSDTSEVELDTTSLVFNKDNWNIKQVVTVTGLDDHLIDGYITTSINLSVDSTNSDPYFHNIGQIIAVLTLDNDVAGLTLTDTTGKTVSENGSTDTFTIAIDTEPQDKVVLEVSSSDTGEVTASPAALTFTKDDYSNKTVTLTGVDDSLIDGNIASNISIAVKNDTSDSQYHNLNKTVSVTTTSDDTAGFTITQTNGNTSVAEDGATDSFSVVLDAQPIIDVVLDISNPNTAELTLDKNSLTFTNSNWNNPQTVTVTGVDDYLKDGNQDTNITLSINSTESDNNFDSVVNQAVKVTTVDNDVPDLIIIEAGGTTSVTEGSTDQIAIKLATQPTDDVKITLAPTDESEVALSSTSITIENAKWNVEHLVTITGVDDTDLDGDITSDINISSTSPASDYNSLSKKVNVITKDNEIVIMSVTGNSRVINNGGAPSTSNDTDFGDVDINTGSATKVFTIHNSGNYILLVDSFNCSGSGFYIQTAAGDVLPGSETIFEIKFDPSTTGEKTATVTITTNDKANSTLNFTLKGTGTEDTVAPTVTAYNPATGATSVSTSTNLELTFIENIVKGTGNITLKKYSDDSIVEAIPVSKVSVVNNIASTTLTNPLQKSTKYYVAIDNTCFKDSSGNAFAGISNKDTWSFTAIKPSNSGSSSTWIPVEVNGEVQQFVAKSQTKYQNGKRVTIVTVDEKKLQKKLEQEEKPVVHIPISNKISTVKSKLNGKIVKTMEQKEAVIEIQTQIASYALPAEQINIDEVSEQLGEDLDLEDIEVGIEIGGTPKEMIKVVEKTAEKDKLTLVVPPVDFTVKCSYKNKTVEVKKYNSYVERTIAIPEGVEASKITTGIVVYHDGSFCHVPTKIIVIGKKYYAKINSLTNSTYSVIYNPQQYEDVEGHWAENICNEMGSRMIVAPSTDTNFKPNQEITRLYFTKTIVKALGIGDKGTVSKFTDVKQTDDYFGYVATALEYNLISGYAVDNTLRPHNKITREEAAALIVRTMKLAGLSVEITEQEIEQELNKFADKDQVGNWAKQVMALCIKNNLLKGNEKGQLCPKSNITKAELAAILYRLLTEAKLI